MSSIKIKIENKTLGWGGVFTFYIENNPKCS